ncbi:MAG: tyrosine-type recombinase/integrase, partial [Thermaceae bacterium]|nr:tyrosine-type recombinase/integrase [Thermaceae bacterium]
MELVALPHWHDPGKRRLLATRAAHERDAETLWSLVQAYLRGYGRKGAAVSPRTLRNYSVALRDYLEWAWPADSPAPQVAILEAGRDELGRYLADLQEHGSFLTGEPLAPGTLALRLAGVRALYRALRWAGAAADPEGFPSVHDPTPAHERRPALPQALYKRLLLYLSGDDVESQRDHLAARLMGEAGLRLSEVVGLEVGHVLLGEGLLEVRKGKGGKARTLPLGRGLVRE